MDIFFFILINNIVPIFLLIGLGYVTGKKFKLSITTLSKLNFYLFVPAFILVNLYQAELKTEMLKVLLFSLVYLIVCDLGARVVSRLRGFDAGLSGAFKNSIMFNNTGNIGLSLVTLVFTSGSFLINGETPYLMEALSVIIAVMVFMNAAVNTVGIYYAGRASMSIPKALGKTFTMPSMYAIPLVLIIRWTHFDLPSTFLWPALEYLNGGLVPIALISLGVQLSYTKVNLKNLDVYLSVFSRLILGPALAVLFILLFGFRGVTAQTLLIAYSVPTAVNTALIAVECKNNEDFATQAVVLSTLLSMVTLTLAIYLARFLFPV